MPELPEVLGVIYPLPKEVTMELFKAGKNIFVKYLTHEPKRRTINRIKCGITLYIYESGGGKKIIADAVIEKQEYLKITEVLQKYPDRLIIPEHKLKDYIAGREMKTLRVLHLGNIRKLKNPLTVIRPVTMAGQYVTKVNYKEIFK